MLGTDVHDEHKQFSRTVCTWPAEGVRDWNTGKLIDKPQ